MATWTEGLLQSNPAASGGNPPGGTKVDAGNRESEWTARNTVSNGGASGADSTGWAEETHRTLRLAAGRNKPASPSSLWRVTNSSVRTRAIGGETRRSRVKRQGRNAIWACCSNPKWWQHCGMADAGD